MIKVLAPILFLMIAGGLFFTYIRPAYDALQSFQSLETKLDDAIRMNTELTAKRQKLRDTVASFSADDVNRLEQMLPDDIDPVGIIIQLDTLAQRNGLQVTAYKLPDVSRQTTAARPGTQQAQAEPKATPVVFGLECTGPYAGLKQFLYQMEGSVGLWDVTGLTINTAQQNQRALPYGQAQQTPAGMTYPTYKIEFDSHWLPPTPDAPPVTANTAAKSS